MPRKSSHPKCLACGRKHDPVWTISDKNMFVCGPAAKEAEVEEKMHQLLEQSRQSFNEVKRVSAEIDELRRNARAGMARLRQR